MSYSSFCKIEKISPKKKSSPKSTVFPSPRSIASPINLVSFSPRRARETVENSFQKCDIEKTNKILKETMTDLNNYCDKKNEEN